MRKEDVQKVIKILMPSCVDGDAYSDEIRSARQMCIDISYAVAALKGEEAAPVIHARWEPWVPLDISREHDYWSCSLCGRRAKGDRAELPYCHCGAKMDGGVAEG